MSAVRRFADLDALSRAAADELIELAGAAIAARGRFHVALSGGSTPKRLFQLLAARPGALPWDRVDVLLTDATETKLRRAGIPRPLGEALQQLRVANAERTLPGTREHVADSGEDDLPVHVL